MSLAPAVGFEPTTKRLTAARSTTELRRSEGTVGTVRGAAAEDTRGAGSAAGLPRIHLHDGTVTNFDDDLFALSNARRGTAFDRLMTAPMAGSYQPNRHSFRVAFDTRRSSQQPTDVACGPGHAIPRRVDLPLILR